MHDTRGRMHEAGCTRREAGWTMHDAGCRTVAGIFRTIIASLVGTCLSGMRDASGIVNPVSCAAYSTSFIRMNTDF